MSEMVTFSVDVLQRPAFHKPTAFRSTLLSSLYNSTDLDNLVMIYNFAITSSQDLHAPLLLCHSQPSNLRPWLN
ncbi:hypothetical protein FKM82_025466 [Ascaphus truei]